SLTSMIASHEDDASAALFLLPRDVRVSRGNHRLPRGHAHPSMRQGTADGHYAIADTHLPQAEPIFLALRGRRDGVALEDVPPPLCTDRQAQIGQSANDPVVAPGAFLLCHTHDQGLKLLVDHGAAGRFALVGTVELLSDERAVPAKNRVRFDDMSDLFQCLLAQLFAKLRQAPSLCVSQMDTTFDLLTQYAVLCHEILIVQQ